ncbi:MAG: hypothetical protein OEQ74_03885 [Gammaproteobacteria bacterium]|nr:hypothetical protein [Gammaproteobacteria bacterium]
MKNRAPYIAAIFFWAGSAIAADFCVDNAALLAQSLDIADNNGQSDVVRLVEGVYTGNFDYNANAAETGDLRIEGGYTPGCADRVIDAANTVLAGNGGRSLNLNGNDNSGLIVEGITVRDGQSALGGAGVDIGRWTTVLVSKNIFSANQTSSGADGSGGLNIDRSVTVEVINNDFIGNTGGKGGGLSMSDPVLATVDANLFLDNTAEQNGGAIDADSAGRFVITNNVIARNNAAEDAAGIGLSLFVDGTAGSADLTNNTITGNTAGQEGGGIDLKMTGDATSVALYNNIVFANAAGLLARDLHLDNDDEQNGVPSSVEMFNNDFDQTGLGLFVAIPFAVDASNLNNVDPLFVNPGADDYDLQAASALIDAGSAIAPELPAADYHGAARIVGVAPDIGAPEFAQVDGDGDGIADTNDNCTLIHNPNQVDTDNDGFGNRCDADLTNNGLVDFLDVAEIKMAFLTTPVSPNWNPHADFNLDDRIDFLDVGIMKDMFLLAPGPSGLVP